MAGAVIKRVESITEFNNNLYLVGLQNYATKIITSKLFSIGEYCVFVKPDTIYPNAEWVDSSLVYTHVVAIQHDDTWSCGDLYPTSIIKREISLIEDMDVSRDLFIHLEKSHGWTKYNIPKTDEIRFDQIVNLPYSEKVDVTLKIDGQSWSAFYILPKDSSSCKEQFGFGSRTQVCDCTDKMPKHPMLDVERKYNVFEKLKCYCIKNDVSLCLRGERYGKKIQNSNTNPHCKLDVDIKFFSVYNITNKQYEYKKDEHYIFKIAATMNIPSVSVLETDVELNVHLIERYQSASSIYVDDKNTMFEGVVVQYSGGSFKILNNVYDSCKK